MYSTIRFGAASKASPQGHHLYRVGVGFELVIKRSQARRLDHSATTFLTLLNIHESARFKKGASEDLWASARSPCGGGAGLGAEMQAC